MHDPLKVDPRWASRVREESEWVKKVATPQQENRVIAKHIEAIKAEASKEPSIVMKSTVFVGILLYGSWYYFGQTGPLAQLIDDFRSFWWAIGPEGRLVVYIGAGLGILCGIGARAKERQDREHLAAEIAARIKE